MATKKYKRKDKSVKDASLSSSDHKMAEKMVFIPLEDFKNSYNLVRQ